MSFDPAAATAAYLAALTPAQHQRAIDYTQGGHWLLLWNCLIEILVALLILRSGVLARLRDRVGGAARPKRTAFVVALAYVALDALLTLPWSIYADWWRERSYGLSSQPFAGWLGERVLQAAISIPLFALFLLALYTLIRRAPRRWWMWCSGVAVAGFVLLLVAAPILIEPLFNRYTPAPAGPVRDRVAALARATGTPNDKIFLYDGSKQSNRYTANVSGLFGSARVAMSDTMFKQDADMAEVIGVVGHEMGHYVRQHVLWFAAYLSVLAIAVFWLVDRLFARVLRWTGDRRVAGLADPAGLPVLMLLVAAIGLLLTPFLTSMTRVAESDADRFSLANAHEPDGLAKALVKTIAYRASSPSALEEFLFYDHPSVERRVRRAMEWKAAHPQAGSAPFGPLPPGK
jgi:STE24 endopeptidase